MAADYDGDRKAEIAVFRRATGAWWIRGQARIDYGSPGDIPVPADYDGDGKADIGVYRPRTNTWLIRNLVTQPFGAPGYLPMALDTDGDGKAEMIMFRRGTGTWFTLNKVTDAIVESTFGTLGRLPGLTGARRDVHGRRRYRRRPAGGSGGREARLHG